jgi:di/tricarboxylate transporter
VAWRRFLLELVLCLVLTAMIVVVVLRARHEVLASPLIAAMVAAILRILWRRDD